MFDPSKLGFYEENNHQATLDITSANVPSGIIHLVRSQNVLKN